MKMWENAETRYPVSLDFNSDTVIGTESSKSNVWL